MDSKKRKRKETNETESDINSNDRYFGILRKCIERLPSSDLLDYVTQTALANDSVLKELKDKMNEIKEFHKVFIRSIPEGMSKEELVEGIGIFGQVQDCNLIVDGKTKKPKGFGFVVFNEFESALEALKARHFEVNGTEMNIHFAVSNKDEKNRSNLVHDSSDALTSDRQIFIRGLGDKVKVEDLKKVFEKFGVIEDCNVPTDKETGIQKGYGFVKFYSSDSAVKSLEMPNKEIKGVKIRCDFSSRKKNNQNSNSNDKQTKNPPKNEKNRRGQKFANVGFRMGNFGANEYNPEYSPNYRARPIASGFLEPELRNAIDQTPFELQQRLQALKLAQAEIVNKLSGGVNPAVMNSPSLRAYPYNGQNVGGQEKVRYYEDPGFIEEQPPQRARNGRTRWD